MFGASFIFRNCYHCKSALDNLTGSCGSPNDFDFRKHLRLSRKSSLFTFEVTSQNIPSFPGRRCLKAASLRSERSLV